MKRKSPQNFIAKVCSLSDYRETGDVGEDTVGIYRRNVAPAGRVDASERDTVLTSGKSRKQIYLDGDLARRKYEDMTSSGIEDLEAGNDHEESTKLNHFREHKKRRTPEAGNVMQLGQETTVEGVQGADELQARTSNSTRRSRSASGVEITPDICGESDLTAENHMAEESSRSSNNDGSSKFGSAAESVSKPGSSKENFRSVSSLGVVHCFLNRTYGGGDVSVLTSSEGPSHSNRKLGKNDEPHSITRSEMKGMKDREGVPKSEPAVNHQLAYRSTEGPSSGTTSTIPTQLWGRSNHSKQEWLQLGVGASSNVQSEPASGGEGEPSSSGQGHEERAFFKRKITTSIDFPIPKDCAANSRPILKEKSNLTPSERQFTGGSNAIPSKCEESSDPSLNLNPPTFRRVHISSLMRNVAASEVLVGKPDLCIFGRRLIQTGTARQELVLAPVTCSGTRKSCSNQSDNLDTGTASIENSFELHRDQDDCQGFMFLDHRGGRFDNRAGPSISSTWTPVTDVQLRSGKPSATDTSIMDHDNFQRQWDNPPSSLSALQRRREDLRHGQVGYSWLPPPAADPAPKLIPTANNFQGWTSSELTSTSKLAALNSNSAAMDIPLEQQAMRGSDEWENLFRKVSTQMLFQSQCHLPEGSSVLVQSAGHETNVGSQENLVALKHAIENIQKRPQWLTQPEAKNFSVASRPCSNGSPQGVGGDSKLGSSGAERPRMSSMISESGPVHSRFASDHLNLSEKPQQRHGWEPVAGRTKLHHGPSVNAGQRSSPETAGKPMFQVLPPGSGGTNHAGIWFILQSAENQNGEGGLPQISKAYLRIKDGNMPVSAVKKYLVSKLGLTSESEVEITCKGQPVVPSLPLQHVRDVIWFSSLYANNNNNNNEQTCFGEREDSTTSASEQPSRPPTTTDRAAAAAGMLSKDILMVLTYRRHPRTLQLSTLLT